MRIEGRYELEPSHFLLDPKARIHLVVDGDGPQHRVTRSVVHPDGRREEASGVGEVYWDSLETVLSGPGGEILRIRSRFERDGEVRGRFEGAKGRARGRRVASGKPSCASSVGRALVCQALGAASWAPARHWSRTHPGPMPQGLVEMGEVVTRIRPRQCQNFRRGAPPPLGG